MPFRGDPTSACVVYRRLRRRLVAGIATIALLSAAADAARRPSESASIDDGFAAFWAAETPTAAAAAADRLLADGVPFDEAFERLRAGRPYGRAPTGRIDVPIAITGNLAFPDTIDVPPEYDPSKRWPVRVQLHGGIGRQDSRPDHGPNRIPGSEPQLYLFPAARADAAWWHGNQVSNVLRLLDRVKRTYNVDESRVYLTGISDGGTGVYFYAMRHPTPFAAFLPLIGDPGVLANVGARPDGQLYPSNAVNRPMFAVNAKDDPLYPVDAVMPWVTMFRSAGVDMTFRPQACCGHDVSWWTNVRPEYEAFVHAHPRTAYPDRLSWETERTDRYNRLAWLLIDELGSTRSDMDLPDEDMAGGDDAYPRDRPSGRVDLERYGNTIKAFTRGVRRFTLLLSPDVIDFHKAVTVTVDGRTAFSGRLKKDPSVLLKWAARDDDRTMLFGAELTVRVPDR
jgi:predicted esterase